MCGEITMGAFVGLLKSEFSHVDGWIVNPKMSSKVGPVCVNFAALVALERLLPSVRNHVLLQVANRSGSVVALVTLVWLFSCMLIHHVNFQ